MEKPMCSICLEGENDAEWVTIACGHVFHNECIKKWENIKGLLRCPVCNKIAISGTIFPLELLFAEKVSLPVFKYKYSTTSKNRYEIEQNRNDLIRYANAIQKTNQYLKLVRSLQRRRIEQMKELKKKIEPTNKLE